MSVTGNQIKLARIALRLSVEDFSRMTRLSTSTIKRIEAEDAVPRSTKANLRAIRSALEAAGIEFIGSPEEGPGIRLWRKAQDSSPTSGGE